MRDLRTVFERARIHLGEVGGHPGHEVAKYQVFSTYASKGRPILIDAPYIWSLPK